ncbi:MAG: PaaI family thioesterase [Pararhodobacter sp.]
MTDKPAASKPAANAASAISGYPFQRLLGFRKTMQTIDRAKLELELREDHLNIIGLPHGGLLASLLDAALGSAGCHMDPDNPRKAVTLNLNVSYIGQPDGTQLIAEGRRVGGGKTIYFSEGEVRDGSGKVLARASGTFRYIG